MQHSILLITLDARDFQTWFYCRVTLQPIYEFFFIFKSITSFLDLLCNELFKSYNKTANRHWKRVRWVFVYQWCLIIFNVHLTKFAPCIQNSIYNPITSYFAFCVCTANENDSFVYITEARIN